MIEETAISVIGLEMRFQSGNEVDSMETPEPGINYWFVKLG